MKQFEYNMLSAKNGTDSEDLLYMLNDAGYKGWEVISMIQSSDKSHFNILLKREIQTDKNGLK